MDNKKILDEIFPWKPEEIRKTKPAQLNNLINGKWITSKNQRQIPDPLNGEPIILAPETQYNELAPFISSLLDCPRYGLHNPLLNTERYSLYGQICAKAAGFLKSPAGRTYFAQLIQRVMPKDIEQCYGEVDVTATFLQNFSGDNVRFLAKGKTTPGTRFGQQANDYPWPYGPVAIVSPFNFPLEIMALQLMGALFMGNKPILKQSSLTSIVGEALARLLLSCGMPKKDMLLIHCSGQVMQVLITHKMPDPIIQLTQITGGSNTAHQLLGLTGGRCRIEDAGFNWKLLGPNFTPHIIDEAADTCDKDAYSASGQKCSAQSIVFAHQKWIDAGLIKKLKELAGKRKLTDLTVGPTLTRDNKQIQEQIDKLLFDCKGILLFGGNPITEEHSIPERYGSFQPTAIYLPLNEILNHIDLVAKEVFGPLQIITSWESERDLEKILFLFEKLKNRLTAGIVDNDPSFINYILGRTTNGTTYAGIKARTTGAPQWHFFGPTGHPASAGIGTPEAIIDVWSKQRTIVFDTNSTDTK